MKRYHFGEPNITDVTSYDDIFKALNDGRLEKIIEEHKKYMKEMDYARVEFREKKKLLSEIYAKRAERRL
jgi:DNA-binding LytR/AlgR family response regulator